MRSGYFPKSVFYSGNVVGKRIRGLDLGSALRHDSLAFGALVMIERPRMGYNK